MEQRVSHCRKTWDQFRLTSMWLVWRMHVCVWVWVSLCTNGFSSEYIWIGHDYIFAYDLFQLNVSKWMRALWHKLKSGVDNWIQFHVSWCKSHFDIKYPYVWLAALLQHIISIWLHFHTFPSHIESNFDYNFHSSLEIMLYMCRWARIQILNTYTKCMRFVQIWSHTKKIYRGQFGIRME